MMSAQLPSSNLTERFAECILALRYDTLPPQAIEMAKQVTLDGLAVILAGAETLDGNRIAQDDDIEHEDDNGGRLDEQQNLHAGRSAACIE
jgi:hypothetical protein